MWIVGDGPCCSSFCVVTEEFGNAPVQVARDMFYDGNTIFERCSVVSRLAPTFMRFGSFEIFNRVDPMTGEWTSGCCQQVTTSLWRACFVSRRQVC